ncbi:olfactory receptor 14K1, partial [Fukomys damarensis]
LMVLLPESEVGILTAMSYDRYVAICHPLHYGAVMSKRFCVLLMAVSWLSGGALGILFSAAMLSLEFCGSNRIHQFFCDVPAILEVSCPEEHAAINVSVALGVLYSLSCLVSILVSYVFIFSSVLKMPSRESRSKAFSTCVPHLMVVGSFFLTGIADYVKPTSNEPALIDLLFSIIYSVTPPFFNPIIYCLRNRDIQSALNKFLRKVK